MGGLGNQLWTVAAAYCVSQDKKCPLYLPKEMKDSNPHNTFKHDYRTTMFKEIGVHVETPLADFLQLCTSQGWSTFSEPRFGFQPWCPEFVTPGAILNSYFQYYPPLKTWGKEFRAALLRGLETHRATLMERYSIQNAAFLHIRRGDYLQRSDIHYMLPLTYYTRAMQMLMNRTAVERVYVLSDDIEWVRSVPEFQDEFQKGFFVAIDEPDELYALAFMSLCTGGAICANSSFSWWGAYLGPHFANAPVFVPQNWIANRVVSLFPDEWIVLNQSFSPLSVLTNPDSEPNHTACITLTDPPYCQKAIKTIQELRGPGRWKGPVVLLAVNLTLPQTLIDRYAIHVHPIERISTDKLVESLKAHPIRPMPDNRHFGKLTQWTKFRVFDQWLRMYKRVVFFDAGIRIFDTIEPLLAIPWRRRFVAPDDCGLYDNGNRFHCQLDLHANPPVRDALLTRFGSDILDKHYFLNCLWIYDTDLLSSLSVADLEDAMNMYPICLCNEMVILNLFFTFALKVWSPMPFRVCQGGKILFGWTDRSQCGGASWKDYHIVKYAGSSHEVA